MSAQHTPGPWGIEVTSDGSWIGPMRAAGDKVANVVVHVDTDREYKMEVLAEKRANASLIAAAPELLEALRKASEFITDGVELGYIRMPDADTPDSAHHTPEIVRAAIAKATGAA